MNFSENKKLGILVWVFIGIFIGFSCEYLISEKEKKGTCSSDLHFIKQNIDCNIYDTKTNTLSNLQDKLNLAISEYIKTKKIQRASVFVRDLSTNRFAGINDTDVYYMASLLKVPVLVGGFKLAEVEPKILDQMIIYDDKIDTNFDQIIKSENTLVNGSEYTVLELMSRAVVYSDNNSAQLLYDYYPVDFMDRIMQALGIQMTKPTGEKENLITARSYANLFRILYNSSYLTPYYSNMALQILSKTTFDKGATAKLPKGVLVAHKFAERTVDYPNGRSIKQFHECGIVYAKDSKEPYTFCIMTEGDSYQDLESVVAEISVSIYEQMIKD